MSLVRIFVDSVVSINKRIVSLEQAIVSISENVSNMSQIIGDNVGKVVFKGNVEFREGDLDKLFNNKSKFEIEALMLDLSLSQGLLINAKESVRNKLYNILKDKEIEYLRDLVDQHKRLEVLISDCEQRSRILTESQIEANKRVDIDIEGKVLKASKDVIDNIEKSLKDVETGVNALKCTKQKMDSVINDALKKSAIINNKIGNENKGKRR